MILHLTRRCLSLQVGRQETMGWWWACRAVLRPSTATPTPTRTSSQQQATATPDARWKESYTVVDFDENLSRRIGLELRKDALLLLA